MTEDGVELVLAIQGEAFVAAFAQTVEKSATKGRISYSTSTARIASAAWYQESAATAATSSPSGVLKGKYKVLFISTIKK